MCWLACTTAAHYIPYSQNFSWDLIFTEMFGVVLEKLFVVFIFTDIDPNIQIHGYTPDSIFVDLIFTLEGRL